MKIRGIITKSAGRYTATVKFGTDTLYKVSRLNTLHEAQEELKYGKKINAGIEDFVQSFPELEGKEVRCITERNDYIGKVIGCDYHIGITIVDTLDKNRYLTCILGPLSVQGRKILKKYPTKYNQYPQLFREAVKAIQSGLYKTESVRVRSGAPKSGTGAGASACAFGV